jgi:hypothetical protein
MDVADDCAQISINDFERHAAMLEGLTHVTRHLANTRVTERITRKNSLPLPYEGHAELEKNLLLMYRKIFLFLVLACRYLSQKPMGKYLSEIGTCVSAH